jgi:FixJ family two-component response regulator
MTTVILNDTDQGQSWRDCVCIVDDEEGVRELLCTLCESTGLTAEAFDSAESFLSHYDPEKARCLVLDMQLPKMSGLELLEKLKMEGITLPVIMMSANADPAVVVRAMSFGVVDFFDKPFNNHALLNRILEIIAQGRSARCCGYRQDSCSFAG